MIIAVLLITKPVGSAIFVSRFGPDALPYAYILTAVAAAIISTGYSQAVKYFSILRVNLWSLGICITALLGCVLLIPLRNTEDFVAVALYIWVALFGVLAASQFWTMASMVFDIRQAKRLFGPIGAGAIAGGIAGGYLASLFAETVGTRVLLIIAALMLIPVILISLFVWRRYIQRVPGRRSVKVAPTEPLSERPHQLILRSRHLMLLCGIIALSVITAKLVDYQFSALASARYADPARLTAFFGFWFSTFNVIGLLIQLLLTQRVLQRLGVSGALMFLPAGLGLGAFVMLFIPTLGTVIFSRCVDGSLKQSLHRAGVEMLYLPVNLRIKNRIKTYIDVLIDSAAGGLSGFLLLFLIDYAGASPGQISILVLVLSLAWFASVLAVREEYLDAFRNQLAHLRPKRSKRKLNTRHEEVMQGFLKVLEEGDHSADAKRLLYVLERTEKMQENIFLKPTERLLFHKDPNVRARALHNLSYRGKNDIFDLVVFMLDDRELVVKKAALEYLINNHLESAVEVIQQQLNHEDPEIAGLALIDLLIETNGNEVLRRRWHLHEVFAERVAALDKMPGDLAFKWRLHLLVAAGRSGTNLGNRFIAKELRSPNEEVIKVAIIAAGETLAERWLLPLIDFLSEAPYRKHAMTALTQYGSKLVRILPRYLRDGVIDIEDLRRLPAVIEGIRGEQTVSLLFSMMEKFFPADLELRLEVLRSLNALRRDFPELPMPRKKITKYIRKESSRYQHVLDLLGNQLAMAKTLGDDITKGREALIKLLQKRREGNLDRMFRLLGLFYAPADIIPIYRGLKTATPPERVSALEFLDTLLDNSLKQSIMPLVEYEVRSRVETVVTTGLSEAELRVMQNLYFSTTLKGTDQKLKAAVLFLLCFRPEDDLESLVRMATKSSNPRVKKMAEQALGRLVEV
ncbi:Npt1/Npt2 family nucleotide transporter [Neolewinella antarctica]|uniref:ADP,ATP carrier protein n=1 Tax=Neolewinella antarctica TaxID=442734 RepID=A0ABX0XI13_9BACT|nr:Npt1/Npt2 family nucleotide transporter [Neolewinella antarctica]NJC28469.1 AAA family ATP:ADP antiporter [Neolewinella antarctica]